MMHLSKRLNVPKHVHDDFQKALESLSPFSPTPEQEKRLFYTMCDWYHFNQRYHPKETTRFSVMEIVPMQRGKIYINLRLVRSEGKRRVYESVDGAELRPNGKTYRTVWYYGDSKSRPKPKPYEK